MVAMNTKSSETAYDVVVVGRGPVGAAAALALSQAGLRAAAVGPADAGADQAAPAGADDWDARVFALSPSAQSLLTALKVWPALDAARLSPVYDMSIWPGTGADAPLLHLSAYEAQVPALAHIVEGRLLGRTCRFPPWRRSTTRWPRWTWNRPTRPG